MDWVPRSVRFKAREIEKAYADLESILKRAPTEVELAERLGVTLRELHDVTSQISFVSVLALDELLSVGSDGRVFWETLRQNEIINVNISNEKSIIIHQQLKIPGALK